MHQFSVTLSFVLKQSSLVLSDEHLSTKLRVTENQCVLFNSLTSVYLALLPQHWALYAKVNFTPTFIYIYTHIYTDLEREQLLLNFHVKELFVQHSNYSLLSLTIINVSLL